MLWARLDSSYATADHERHMAGAGCALAVPSLLPVNQPLPTSFAKVQTIDEWGQVRTERLGLLLIQGELLEGWGIQHLAMLCDHEGAQRGAD